MRACGIVVEYNPFHNGHLIHAQQSRQKTDSELVIAVMSGNFLQRGEPAILPKQERAEMALRSGVDIVFELPYHFAVQHASIFAEGAVKLLHAAGCSSICFGSENGRIKPFLDQLQLEKEYHDVLQETIREQMKLGRSYPSAAAESYRQLFEHKAGLDLSRPNNMLGYQYVKAADLNASSMSPYTIKRTASEYHDESLHETYISSATSIRKKMFEEGLSEVKKHVPEATFLMTESYINDGGQLMNWERYWPFIQHTLLTSSPQSLNNIYEMEEGIEYRLIAAAASSSFHEFMHQVKTKRYTWTRIQRILTHLLTKTLKTDVQQNSSPSYLRMLGMTGKGREYLNMHKADFALPVISKLSRKHEELCAIDIRASKTYAMGFSDPVYRQKMISRDFTAPPVIL
ncbi:hypothetical protein KP77_17390 [Jeotgalibacillus alimentarius]|uniref:tRNA(Met) cytidine acetate ligase n=1 Tax=Jeotgalibacillus alimentarius TaxID=135826 RepID=A0A0C2S8Q9_9BACL|nr:nucleotidyltransferase [Jeotgalibacillus alimentarius]KIL50364.1 hypothetical protein KP77_17390 [Jeotgalibacillus alimentarius]